MTKKEMEQELKRLLEILITGNSAQIKTAKKEIEKLCRKERKAFEKGAYVALEYLPKFDQIKKTENQAAFVSGLSLFFLTLSDEYFNELAEFTLKVFQHPNGTVREAIRKTADWLHISLTSRVNPFVYPKGKKLTEKQKNEQKEAEHQYIALVDDLELLIKKYDDGTEEFQYIQDLKPSVNKSLQLFWSRLTHSRTYQRILEKNRPVPAEIALKRKEIVDKLKDLLKSVNSSYNMEDIKDLIFNEDNQDFFPDAVAMFDTGEGEIEIQDIINAITDAWNYFPHKTLNGLSPAEKSREQRQIERFFKAFPGQGSIH